MQFVETPAAPLANGHYQQAVVANGLVFVSAQLPLQAGPSKLLPDGIDAQAEQALRNVIVILDAAGSGAEFLASATVYVTDIAHWPRVDAVFCRLLPHKPARAVVACAGLHFGAMVAVQAIGISREVCGRQAANPST